MQSPPTPVDERARLDTLRALNILDTAPEERFDRLTRLAQRLFGVNIALVSLVDENRQWFKSRVGLAATETPRDVSFCGHAILGDDILLVPDALADERFRDNPLVTGEPKIRFYAGCPLRVPNGGVMGTLCLIDDKPRELDDEGRALLRDLASMAEQEIAAVQLATMDDLTTLSNRRGFEALSQHALKVCKRMKKPASMLYFDLSDFKKINDTYGHAEGDRALVAFGDLLRTTLRDCDVIGRIGGDEFAALLTDSNLGGTAQALQRLQLKLDSSNLEWQRGYAIRYNVGQTEYDAHRHTTVADMLAEADAAMYVNKRALKVLEGKPTE
jgi:diguanylate cyclase (GGDEF)-like protein